MARNKSKTRPAPGPTFLKERPEYLQGRQGHAPRRFEDFDLYDVDWPTLGLPFEIDPEFHHLLENQP